MRLKNKDHSIPMSSRNPAQRVWPEARGHCGAYRRVSGKMENSGAPAERGRKGVDKQGRAREKRV